MTGAKFNLATLALSAALIIALAVPSNAQELRKQAVTEANLIADTVLEAFADSMSTTRFALASDLRVATAAIWDRDGALLFPDLRLDHVQLELSKSETDGLYKLMQENAGQWHQSALKPGRLIFCQKERSACLILSLTAFADALGVTSVRLDEALFQARSAETKRSLAGPVAAVALVIAALIGASFLRRTRKIAKPQSKDPDQFAIADISISPASLKAKRAGQEVALTRRDVTILRYMHDRKDAVVSKDELYDAGWGRDYMPNSRALDQHILALRRKLNPNQTHAEVIETVHGAGYRLAP